LRGKLHLILEEGTYSAWLYDLLEGRVEELAVCDPRHNALLKEGNKSDAGDARKLAGLLREGMLRAVYHGSRSLRNLQELAHSHAVLVKDTTRGMNRIKALYCGRGIDCAGRGVYAQGQPANWQGRPGHAANCFMSNLTICPASEERHAGRYCLRGTRLYRLRNGSRTVPGTQDKATRPLQKNALLLK
jgi:hypothetical protein